MVLLLLVFMQLTRDLFAIAKFLWFYRANRHSLESHRESHTDAADRYTHSTPVGVSQYTTIGSVFDDYSSESTRSANI